MVKNCIQVIAPGDWGVDSQRVLEREGVRSKRACCAGAVARLLGIDRTTDFLSVEVSINAGMGGTGGGGDAIEGLGGGER
jgi:hypothetical protein